jgi:hypothetical protein
MLANWCRNSASLSILQSNSTRIGSSWCKNSFCMILSAIGRRTRSTKSMKGINWRALILKRNCKELLKSISFKRNSLRISWRNGRKESMISRSQKLRWRARLKNSTNFIISREWSSPRGNSYSRQPKRSLILFINHKTRTRINLRIFWATLRVI